MAINASVMKGVSFGLTSGIITTLGLIVGLHSGIGSKTAVLGGIVTIAVADAFSDALGIHISEEAENTHTTGEVWQATISTFLTKFLFALTFLVPILLLPLEQAIYASIAYGLTLICLFSYSMAKRSGMNRLSVMGEHLLIAIIVIIIAHYVGDAVAMWA